MLQIQNILHLQRSPTLLLQNLICFYFKLNIRVSFLGLDVHLMGRSWTSNAVCTMLSTVPRKVIDYAIWKNVCCRKLMDFSFHLIQNNALKLLYVIGALLAVLVTGAGCWTLCGCSMGGLSRSIWSAGCHTHTQVSLSGSGLSFQKLLCASSNTSVLISPNRYS